jgi:hypothetical protein
LNIQISDYFLIFDKTHHLSTDWQLSSEKKVSCYFTQTALEQCSSGTLWAAPNLRVGLPVS